MKADPQGYLGSKYECFLMSGCRTQCDVNGNADRADHNTGELKIAKYLQTQFTHAG